jgi:outer membrane protein OmpA-like peptidoglycan-associated protein
MRNYIIIGSSSGIGTQLLLFIFFLLPFLLLAQSEISFLDEFNYKDIYWSNSTWDDAIYYRKIEGGKYNMEHRKSASQYVTYKNVYLEKDKPFLLQAKIMMTKGETGATISLKLGNKKGVFFLFDINPIEQKAGVRYKIGKTQELLLIHSKLTPSSVNGLNKVNSITIHWTMNELIYSVNEQEIFRVPSSQIASYIPHFSSIGILSAKKSTFWLDDIIIKQTITEINTVKYREDTFKKELLPKQVNTNTSERTPVISHDGKTLYFIRKGHSKNRTSVTMDDVWTSEITEDSMFSEAQIIAPPINNKEHNAVVSVSADNTNLLLLGVYDNNGQFKKNGLSTSTLKKEGWGLPVELVVEDYYNKAQYMEASLSSDKSVLILGLQRDKTEGMNDLYVSFKQKNGQYSIPVNMGKQINTTDWEITPFLAADDKTLYFSSKGHKGFGNFDVFVSKRKDDTWTNWSKPVNLGSFVNTTGYDAFFSIAASGNYAYMVADYSGNNDIYRLKIPASNKPEPVAVLSGFVRNGKDSLALEAKISILELETNKAVAEFNSSAKDGSYTIILPFGKKYAFFANKERFYPLSENVDFAHLENYKEVKKDLYLFPVEQGQLIELNNVFFDPNKSTLIPTSFYELNKLVHLMNSTESIVIELRGHTDAVGKDDYNLTLSKNRATSVRAYLLSKGINENRITAKGYGETIPIYSNKTETGKSKNRRVEFFILKI